MGGTDEALRDRGIDYTPLESQQRFHDSTARFKGFSGPVGSGKSKALCHEAIRLSYLNPGRQGLIGAPTFPMLRDATLSSFLEILRENHIPYFFNKAESLLNMADTGSKILFRSLDEFERLRGTNLAWFAVDEMTYTSEQAWLRLESRLRDPRASRLCGIGVWTPKGFDWVYKRFIRNPIKGYKVVLAKAFENRHLLDVVPDFYERLKDSYDERFYEQEVLGQYLNVNSGAVYYAFDRRLNLRDVTLDPALPLYWTLDFNVDPMCSLVAQMGIDGVSVVDEIVLGRASTYAACEEFERRFPNHQSGVYICGDASGSKLQTAGTTDYRIISDCLTRAGYRNVTFQIPLSNPLVRQRVQLTNSMLCSAAGEPRIAINTRCRELISDLEEVSYKADSMMIDKDRDPRRTHLSDALGYLLWQEFEPTPRPEPQSRLYW